jgi:hypothetical protein
MPDRLRGFLIVRAELEKFNVANESCRIRGRSQQVEIPRESETQVAKKSPNRTPNAPERHLRQMVPIGSNQPGQPSEFRPLAANDRESEAVLPRVEDRELGFVQVKHRLSVHARDSSGSDTR